MAALPVAVLIAAVLVLAACSQGGKSPAVASGSSRTAGNTSPAAAAPTKASALAYSQCMRAHGLSDFPDPDSNGDIQLNVGPGSDLSRDNPTFQAADNACKSLLPPNQAPPANLKAENLKYAQCMRAHGLSDFPDPNPDGTLQINATPGSDLQPSNPRYQSANNACKQYLPGGGSGGSLNTAGAGS